MAATAAPAEPVRFASNWQMTSIADGFLIVRHPELQATLRMADRVGSELHLFAG